MPYACFVQNCILDQGVMKNGSSAIRAASGRAHEECAGIQAEDLNYT